MKDRPLFFLSAPRTRSSILFEMSEPYINTRFELRSLKGHSEFFLTRSPWAKFVDKRTGQEHQADMYPVADRSGDITMHHVWPSMYKDMHEAVEHKCEFLATLQAQRKHYNVKGTLECGLQPELVILLFRDRHFVFTKRRNITDMVASTLFALRIKAFHMRPNNEEHYRQSLSEPITLTQDELAIGKRLLIHCNRLWAMENMCEQMNLPYSTVYYEDLDTEDHLINTLTELHGTPEWVDYLSEDYHLKVPMRIDKDYCKLITNYDDIEELVNMANETTV